MTDINKSIAELLGRDLTDEEITCINNLKGRFHISDTKPLAIVLALVGANHVLFESMPNLLQQKASETIKRHRTTLSKESTTITQELIGMLSHNIAMENARYKTLAIWFSFGSIFGGMLVFLISHSKWLRT